MSKELQVIFSGVGGQGLMLAGELLGAAAVAEGKFAAMSSSYGVETRGTFTKSGVIVSTEEVDYPEVLHPDAVFALARPAFEKYASEVKRTYALICDADAYDSERYGEGRLGVNLFTAPILKLAKEAGNPAGANIVALGILIAKYKPVSLETVINAIEERFGKNPKVAELNVACLLAGEMKKEVTR